MQILFGSTEKITEAHAQQWLTEFSPWRALVAAHLWKMPTAS
jgi:DNA-3-methyladenine glycosylase II